MEFNRIIKLLRKERGITQKQAAEDLGVSQALLSHYEKGIRECGLDFVVRVADYYNVSCDYLLGRSAARTGMMLNADDLPNPDKMKDNVYHGSVLPTMNKKLISNSLNVLYAKIGQCHSKALTTEVSAYLMMAVAKMFRLLYSAEPHNAQSLFSGWLFLCSSGAQLTDFEQQFWSSFLMSACVMLLRASVLTRLLMRQLTDPLQKVTDAAQRFGGGDLSVRVEGVEGDGEVADLARTFNQMAENIQSNDNSRGQFMGNIAHELRTPMTTIKGFVDGMLDGTIPPDMQNHYLQLVSEETGRLARLIQNMLDLSKLESGEYQVNARMFNIWETLTGVALAAEQRINDGMIELAGLTMDEKVLVYADPDLIHQVAYNLLDNAIKFTPAGGTIRFSVEKLGPEAEISIWNSGQGISPEALPYVFQRFYKEDRSRGLHARGAGLGLNICKVLVNLAGGQIRVESQQGEWCRFVFTLPTCSPNPGGMKRLPDAAGQPGAVEDPASMKPVE